MRPVQGVICAPYRNGLNQCHLSLRRLRPLVRGRVFKVSLTFIRVTGQTTESPCFPNRFQMISHARETLFVHIPKTGGQSVEMVFLEDQGLSWRDRQWLLLRHNKNRAAGPQKLAHLFASEYVSRGHITPERFARYRKFTIVRHPYDRILSEYQYRVAAQKRRKDAGDILGFDDFLAIDFSDDYLDLSRHLIPQTRYVTGPRGDILVDSILRFETLAQDTARLFVEVFGKNRPLPHRNRTTAKTIMSANMLSKSQKALLYDRYHTDFEAFGYAP